MSVHENPDRHWEQMGAMSGLFVSLLFITSFAIFLATDPSGGNTAALPDIAGAEAAPAFFADHLQAIRAQVMLNSIGLAFFLWFLGTLWSSLRSAERGNGRGSAIAASGALAGVALTLVGLILLGTATLTTSSEQAAVVPTLYTAAAVATAFGGALFTIFYLGVAEVSIRYGGLPSWLGYLAILAAVVSVFGFVTPYATTGVFNAANGAIGFYGHYAAFVIWVLLASIAMVLGQHRQGRESVPAEPAPQPATVGTEAEGSLS